MSPDPNDPNEHHVNIDLTLMELTFHRVTENIENDRSDRAERVTASKPNCKELTAAPKRTEDKLDKLKIQFLKIFQFLFDLLEFS